MPNPSPPPYLLSRVKSRYRNQIERSNLLQCVGETIADDVREIWYVYAKDATPLCPPESEDHT